MFGMEDQLQCRARAAAEPEAVRSKRGDEVQNGSAEGVLAALLREQTDQRSLDDIVEALVGEHGAVDLTTSSWGDKVGISVFDEQDILGPYDPALDYPGEDEDYVYDPDLNPPELPEDPDEGYYFNAYIGLFEPIWRAAEEEDFLEEAYLDGDDVEAYLRHLESATSIGPPRMARRIQSFCCVYRLEEEAPECCPICLDTLAVGDKAWRLPCMHVMHEDCLQRFLRSRCVKGACPLCRCDLSCIGVASLLTAPLGDRALLDSSACPA